MIGSEKRNRDVESRQVRRKRQRKSKKKLVQLSRRLEVVDRELATLKPYECNARLHTAKQIRKIADSIDKYGWTIPILVDRKLNIIAGHGRVDAAKLIGIEVVPTICLDRLTEGQVRAYRIADNRLSEIAEWDPQRLAAEFQFLLELDFDVTLTGFDVADVDVMIQNQEGSLDVDGADEIPDPAPPVSKFGDLWILGRHFLLCGDATDPAAFKQLLRRVKAQEVFIDPPYNVRIDGHVCGLGAIKHREFAMASGEMSFEEYIDFLTTILALLVQNSVDGSIHFVCIDWRHLYELLSAGRTTYTELKNLCVWDKENGGMGSLYRSKHELIAVFKNGRAPHVNNIELGSHGRNRPNVWTYPGANSFHKDRRDDLAQHPTVKPVKMVADAILDCSTRGGIVLDCFGGSGTTLIAAEKTGRRAYLMELDETYVDVTIKRFEKLTGTQATHAVTGQTFAEVQRERAAQSAVATEPRTRRRKGNAE